MILLYYTTFLILGCRRFGSFPTSKNHPLSLGKHLLPSSMVTNKTSRVPSPQRSSSDQMFLMWSCFIGTPQNRIQRNSIGQKVVPYQDQIALGIFILLLNRYSSWSGSNTSISLDQNDVCVEDPEGGVKTSTKYAKPCRDFLSPRYSHHHRHRHRVDGRPGRAVPWLATPRGNNWAVTSLVPFSQTSEILLGFFASSLYPSSRLTFLRDPPGCCQGWWWFASHPSHGCLLSIDTTFIGVFIFMDSKR